MNEAGMSSVIDAPRQARNEIRRRSLTLSKWLCAFAAAIPALAVVGWIFNIAVFMRIHPALPALQPNSALGLFLLVIATIFTGENHTGRWRLVSCVIGIAAVLIGLLTLSEYVFSWNLGIDRILLGRSAVAGLYPGRPGPQTAANLALLGVASLIYNSRFLPIRAGQVFVITAGANAVVAMTGYIFNTKEFYGFPTIQADIGMGLNSALSFILISLAILCSRPNDGMMSLVTSDTRSGGMARQILAVGILAPPLVGALTRIGVFANWYDVSIQVSLFAVVIVGLLLHTTWRAARQSEQDELRTKEQFDETQAANSRLQKAIDERRMFEALIENSSDSIGIADPNGNPIYINPAGRRMVGLPLHDGIKDTQISDYYAVGHRAFASNVIVPSMVGQGYWRGETYLRHWQTEEPIPVSDEHFMILDPESGRVLGMGTVIRDISEARRVAAERERLLERTQQARQQAETAIDQLRESEERFRLTIDEAPIGMALISLDGRPVRVNRALCEILGYTPAELMNLTYQKVTHPDDLEGEEALARKLIRGEISKAILEKRDIRKDGSIVDIKLSASVLRDRDGAPQYYISQIEDITERKHIENEQRFLAEVGAVLASTLDYETTLNNIAQLAVRDLADFCTVDVVDHDGAVRRLKALCRDPSKQWICDSLMRIGIDLNKPCLVKRVFENQETVLIERLSAEKLAALGQSEEHLRALKSGGPQSVMAVPLLAHGRLVGAICFVSYSTNRLYGLTDVRLAKELALRAAFSIENARLFDEVHRAVKTREEVLAVVSHDLKNPLATIKLAAHLLLKPEPLEANGAKEFVRKIYRSTDQMESLIADLLDFAKIQSGTFSVERSAKKLHQVIIRVIDSIRIQAEAKRQTLEVDLPSSLPDVAVDARRIGQVVSNLVRNAIKFTPQAGTIRISARQEDQRIVVSIADTGPGIPQEHLVQIFERFWQVPSRRKNGSGLGLSIAKGIVEAHGGKIWAESQLGKGCSFFFTLCLADLDDAQRFDRAA
jgi:PAS domain S-box-containing protein